MVYLGSWSCVEDVERDFGLEVGALKNVKVIVAAYDQPDYEGSAFVLLKRGRKYFEVNGSHCSCMGLEEQWSEEEVTLKELRHRVKEGNLGHWLQESELAVLEALAKV